MKKSDYDVYVYLQENSWPVSGREKILGEFVRYGNQQSFLVRWRITAPWETWRDLILLYWRLEGFLQRVSAGWYRKGMLPKRGPCSPCMV